MLMFCEIVYEQQESWTEFQESTWLPEAAFLCLTIILPAKSYSFPNREAKT